MDHIMSPYPIRKHNPPIGATAPNIPRLVKQIKYKEPGKIMQPAK
jgi:hypothetical protein